jgi:hypothetical protein
MKVQHPNMHEANKMNFAHKAMTFIFRGHNKEFQELMSYPKANNGCFSGKKVEVECKCEKV